MQYSRSWSCSMGRWVMSAAIGEASENSFTKLTRQSKNGQRRRRRTENKKVSRYKANNKSSKTEKEKIKEQYAKQSETCV